MLEVELIVISQEVVQAERDFKGVVKLGEYPGISVHSGWETKVTGDVEMAPSADLGLHTGDKSVENVF